MNQHAKPYFKNFDGLRFFAALAVICAHYITFFSSKDPSIGKWEKIIFSFDNSGAEAGVNFFFVLSGFLITYLILTESGSTDIRSVKNFYMRRILRIWPLYFLSITIGFLVYPLVVEAPAYLEIANWKMYVAFLANIDQIYFWNKATRPNPLLGVHWSIAVEEQFYLIWPWIFFLARKQFVWIGMVIWLIAVIFQAYTALPTHTISSFHDLVIGGMCAYFSVYYPKKLSRFLGKINTGILIFIYLIGLTIVLGRFQLMSHFPFYEFVYRTIHAIIFSFVILDQGFNQKSLVQCANIPFIGYFGKISYGLYLLHPISILLVSMLLFDLIPSWSVLPCIIATSLLISSVSYRYFESYFMKLKLRYN